MSASRTSPDVPGVRVEPGRIQLPSYGGAFNMDIFNDGPDDIIYKAKLNDTKDYFMVRKSSFVRSGTSLPIILFRKPNCDSYEGQHLYLKIAVVDKDCKLEDPVEAFKEHTPVGTIILAIKIV